MSGPDHLLRFDDDPPATGVVPLHAPVAEVDEPDDGPEVIGRSRGISSYEVTEPDPASVSDLELLGRPRRLGSAIGDQRIRVAAFAVTMLLLGLLAVMLVVVLSAH